MSANGDLGRVASPNRLSSTTEPASSLGPTGFDPARKLPVRYDRLVPAERRKVREEYARLQNGKCYKCGSDLASDPPEHITRLNINWKRFPPNFLRHPQHLHHSHRTGMTIGTVHAYCNAVLWQYDGE